MRDGEATRVPAVVRPGQAERPDQWAVFRERALARARREPMVGGNPSRSLPAIRRAPRSTANAVEPATTSAGDADSSRDAMPIY